ncbi:hypothetical protein TNCT_403071 [Trichonephila clavata]|uniref:Uncharacterized protein n=1 Tax=Trichonephila clavata TaxID=2740835 RepID=A0A8X6IFW4_TRICU|nr:hypothetical protein TNCT_403071 [Trichonephila clavata]
MSSEDALYLKRIDLASDVVSFVLSCYKINWISPWHQRSSPPESSFTEKHAQKVAKLLMEFGEKIWELLENLEHMSIRKRSAVVGTTLLRLYGYGPYTEKRLMKLCIGFSTLLVFTALHRQVSLYWKIMRGLYFYIYNPPWYFRSLLDRSV